MPCSYLSKYETFGGVETRCAFRNDRLMDFRFNRFIMRTILVLLTSLFLFSGYLGAADSDERLSALTKEYADTLACLTGEVKKLSEGKSTSFVVLRLAEDLRAADIALEKHRYLLMRNRKIEENAPKPKRT